MRAAVFKGPNEVEIENVPDPVAEPGGIVLKVEACTICGTDIRTYRHGNNDIQLPQVLGHELVGTVTEVGGTGTNLEVGRRVAVNPGVSCGHCRACTSGRIYLCESSLSVGYEIPGAFAEYIAIPEVFVRNKHIIPVPDGVVSEHACIMEPLAVVLNTHERCYTGLNDVVVILGAGPIGAMHYDVARARGAGCVIVADILGARLARIKKKSPHDRVVNLNTENIDDIVRECSDGVGADVVITANPSPQSQIQSISLAAPRGRIVFFGGLPPAKAKVELDTNVIHYQELEIYGLYGSHMRHNYEAIDMLASGRIDASAIVTHRLPLEEITRGIEMAEQGTAMRVAIVPDGETPAGGGRRNE